jgi:hypothetical protein
MPRHSHQDRTQFFSVVGAPYISEQHGAGHYTRERRTDDQRPRKLRIGIASAFAGFCAVVFGVSLFATDGPAKLAEVAFNAVK